MSSQARTYSIIMYEKNPKALHFPERLHGGTAEDKPGKHCVRHPQPAPHPGCPYPGQNTAPAEHNIHVTLLYSGNGDVLLNFFVVTMSLLY